MQRWKEYSLLGVEPMWNMVLDFWTVQLCLIVTSIATSRYGDQWCNLRHLMALEIFSTSRLNGFLSIRRDEIKLLLRKLYRNSSRDFARVELKSKFSELTFNIMMRMIAGKRYCGENDEEELSNNEEAKEFREIVR
ncbi:hypothetical protein HYC85_031601 [Camellia sinensis]|uniref:Cytochrome P450 n=1 Tax=Camellia sinensis TaxID=4442 RepID=A0A7J7FSP9_CAMSI|nr:hypothetical protein HYC85_031601 [Camellia sinensis]